ncbi:MAG: Lsr2 family protein [Tessaracoccus sp.]|uniref:histone-like nucleoid-structuring protein Lsr2 n=1 Tax=Tessaracoccus sp. TaxID=1971211 RepID=UPI001EC994C2|nr:Lsr2 family protein [Tessaracoccus sp.]MBK7822600.1 Lsr2 family protein [Tessaracoccus sp.]
MAREIRVILTDDIDGSADARAVEFSLDKAEYTIDLSDANVAKLEAALAPFIAKAERVGRRKASSGRKAARSPKGGLAEIRTWARDNGYEVSDRGRIPANVMEAYEAAN